jgi:hypothetical protein
VSRGRGGRRLALVGVVALVLALLGGCRWSDDVTGRDCTGAGCDDHVSVRLTGTGLAFGDRIAVELCLDDRCGRAEGELEQTSTVGTGTTDLGSGTRMDAWLDGDLLVLVLEAGEPGSLRGFDGLLRVDVRSDGAEVAAFTETVSPAQFHPNGPDCEPTCWIVRLERSAV